MSERAKAWWRDFNWEDYAVAAPYTQEELRLQGHLANWLELMRARILNKQEAKRLDNVHDQSSA